MKKKSVLVLSGCMALVLLLAVPSFISAATPVPAKTYELKAVGFLPLHINSIRFLKVFADRVNERSKGELVIKLLGGPEVMPRGIAQSKSVSTGVIDILGGIAAFFEAEAPENLGVSISQFTPSEERKNGFYDWLNERYQKKLNLYYAGRLKSNSGFFLFTRQPVEKFSDLAGRKVAVSEATIDWARALGTTAIKDLSQNNYCNLVYP